MCDFWRNSKEGNRHIGLGNSVGCLLWCWLTPQCGIGIMKLQPDEGFISVIWVKHEQTSLLFLIWALECTFHSLAYQACFSIQTEAEDQKASRWQVLASNLQGKKKATRKEFNFPAKTWSSCSLQEEYWLLQTIIHSVHYVQDWSSGIL